MIIFVLTAMNNYNKGKAKYILASMMMGLFISVTIGSTGNKAPLGRFYKTLTTDTIPGGTNKKVPAKKNELLPLNDTIPRNPGDTI